MIKFDLIPFSYMVVLGHQKQVSRDGRGWICSLFMNEGHMDLKPIVSFRLTVNSLPSL